MDEPTGAPPRASRPVDVADLGRLYAIALGARVRVGPETAVGAPLRSLPTDADAGTARGFGSFGGGGDARKATETLREVSWEAQRTPLGSGETLPGP